MPAWLAARMAEEVADTTFRSFSRRVSRWPSLMRSKVCRGAEASLPMMRRRTA